MDYRRTSTVYVCVCACVHSDDDGVILDDYDDVMICAVMTNLVENIATAFQVYLNIKNTATLRLSNVHPNLFDPMAKMLVFGSHLGCP